VRLHRVRVRRLDDSSGYRRKSLRLTAQRDECLLFLPQAFEDRDFRTLTSRMRSLAVIVLPAGVDLSGRIETEQENHQDKDDCHCAHGSSITGKKSPRRECRSGHRATDSRRQTRRKRSSLIPEQLSLSSRYFLKRSKTDISQTREISCAIVGRSTRETVPRRRAFFPYLVMILDRLVRSPRRHGLASPRRVFHVVSSDLTSCDHALPFITTQ
jgi:hypothetical protein